MANTNTETRLSRALENARRLTMSDALIDQKAKKNRSLIESSIVGGGDGNEFNMPLTPQPEDYASENNVITEETVAKSRLPKAILESFKATPPIEGIDESSNSVLDSIIRKTPSLQRKPQFAPSQPVHEMATTPAPVASASIDYSLIKTIIDESIKRHMGAYIKKMLNESKTADDGSGKINFLHLGDDFVVVTDDGDMYKAELKYVKNIKQKK